MSFLFSSLDDSASVGVKTKSILEIMEMILSWPFEVSNDEC